MVISGLSTFIDNNKIFIEYQLNNTFVVIDGDSLIYQIYVGNETNCIFGGDYDKFAIAVQNYFTALKECGITPIVIFSGGISELQLEMNLRVLNRRMEQIKSTIEDEKYKVPPINLHAVFKSVLSELGVIQVQCDYECNNHAVSIANHYKCPVLSGKSDFYIYDLPHGFVRLSRMSNIVKIKDLPDGSQIRYLPCEMYFVDILIICFPLRDRKMLRLWATLVGNEYINPANDLKIYYILLGLSRENKFREILNWLCRLSSLNEAKHCVSVLIANQNRDRVAPLIEKSISHYELQPSNMVAVLNAVQNNDLEEIVKKSNLVVPTGMTIPDEFIVVFHKGLLDAFILDVITFKRRILKPQVEDFSKPSAFECSLYIRKVIYGILLQHSLPSSKCTETEEYVPEVEEYVPKASTTQMVSVKCLIRLENGEEVPTLLKIYRMQRDETRRFLIRVLRLDEKFFLDIEGELQLLFGCIYFWFLETKPPEAILSALILTIIHFQLQESITEKNLEVNPVVEWRSVINRPSAKLVLQNFEKYIQKPVFQERNSFDISIVHSYSQLQACIHDITALNRLLNFPFKEPKLHKFLNGTMLYNLTKELQSRSNIESAVKVVLERKMNFVSVYEAFINKFV